MKPQACRWYEGLPDVTAQFDCGGQPHHIVWHRGKLVLADHDVLSERLLVALGSEPPLCLEVLDAWRRLRGPELLQDLLVVGGVSPDELAQEKLRQRDAIRSDREFMEGPAQVLRGLRAIRQRTIEYEQREWAATLLHALPAEFRRRLALTVIVGLERHWHDEEFRRGHREQVDAALARTAGALVERSARRSRRVGILARFAIESHVLAPGEPSACTLRFEGTGGAGTLSLPLAWFTDVWARGLGLVDDCFVTRCAEPAADAASLPVLALRWERDERNVSRSVEAPAVVTRGDDGAWALEWD